MLIYQSEIKEVNGISNEEKQRIMDFLQGAVYCWCNKQKQEWFVARDFLGGDNYHWEGTPMFILYERTQNEEQAGKNAGWLLKQVLNDDRQRTFESRDRYRCKEYRWILNKK